MKKFFTVLIGWLFFSSCAEGQIVMNNELEKDLFNARVKLVDEFILRFNCGKFTAGIDTTKKDSKVLNILSLFDAQMFGSKEQNDSIFNAAQTFAADALKSKVKIDYVDTNWVALAPCHGKLRGKDVDFMMFLSVENCGKDMYKWVIDKVKGDIFSLTPSDTSKMIKIMPDDHETNFMVLNRITTKNLDFILNYRQKDYELDETAVFYTLINTGQLTIEYVAGLQFMFLQIPGWVFTIKEFDRMTKNAGWLITSFSKMSDVDKKKFLNSIYNVK